MITEFEQLLYMCHDLFTFELEISCSFFKIQIAS